ncbi:transcriptional regulator, BadM/Rrf2 family [Chthonomonas calidirosea]|uniref:Transcriptional regulator, BadM/Rrf2 family n=1 Tax=Chthonomonas calidirosea (strain DSM 23976 / ICMP 18418 / T49) TaxID=1303518 RepID=S0ESU1_CHTCT|nr:Rrf2 family transcriptional regulator [Chthonomonas calidirosea]CCW34436.1 transcriptional regulator, BadM/Rrf2 family [Chthonomonas calidirosea T49]CEK14779.1 transcriptional regulator, BadM/Rrf2 family [Chthonomonas calidirosea]
MISLSKQTDYGLLALSYLAHVKTGRAVNAREIAIEYGIPQELLAKILQRLARARLVVSTAGPNGGYRLAKPAEQISIGAVIEAIDGPPAFVYCMKEEHLNACEQMPRCTIRAPLARINARLRQMLNLITLAEICGGEAPAVQVPTDEIDIMPSQKVSKKNTTCQ